jgi:hypothetical protein
LICFKPKEKVILISKSFPFGASLSGDLGESSELLSDGKEGEFLMIRILLMCSMIGFPLFGNDGFELGCFELFWYSGENLELRRCLGKAFRLTLAFDCIFGWASVRFFPFLLLKQKQHLIFISIFIKFL